MSDRMAVMAGGLIEQIGTPADVYDSPATAYVADFHGSANVLDVEVAGPAGEGRTTIRVGGETLTCRGSATADSDVRLVIRPERLLLESTDEEAGTLSGSVVRAVYQGATTDIIVALDNGSELVVRRPSERAGQHAAGDQVTVHCRADAMRLLPVGALVD